MIEQPGTNGDNGCLGQQTATMAARVDKQLQWLPELMNSYNGCLSQRTATMAARVDKQLQWLPESTNSYNGCLSQQTATMAARLDKQRLQWLFCMHTPPGLQPATYGAVAFRTPAVQAVCPSPSDNRNLLLGLLRGAPPSLQQRH